MPHVSQSSMFILIILLSGCLPKNQQSTFIEPHCLNSQSQCLIKTDISDFDILFNVKTVITEQEFNIIIKNNSLNENLVINGFIEGKDMYMGKIPLFFQKNDKQIYIATTMLGSCSEEEMIWRMWLTVTDKLKKEETQKFFIDFKSYRR